MTKSIDDLIPDMLKLFSIDNNHIPSDENLEALAIGIKTHVKKFMLEAKKEDTGRVLRMSSIGKKPRQLWYESRQGANGVPKVSKFSNTKLFSLLYGCLIEELVLFLAKEAGHTVDREQKEVELEGIKGRLDFFIDGILVDAKSASFHGFKKFDTGSLLQGDDDFGYVDQISGYAQAEGEKEAAFLAVDKSSGEMALLKLNDLDLKDVVPQIKELKIALSKDTPPPKCYEDVAEGTSGNRGLCKQCSWCPFKNGCWKDANGGRGLQVYKYANGYKFLTSIKKTPLVPNVTEDWILGKES